MNLNDTLSNSISKSTIEVFSTMLSLEVEVTESLVEKTLPEATDGLVSFIGVAGCLLYTSRCV